MSVKSERGAFGEGYVAERLQKEGYIIKERNFRVKGGELDIIAEKDGIIAVVEVKTRKFGSLTEGVEAITRRKMDCIIKAARLYLLKKGIEDKGVRFDVAEVTVTTENIPRVLGFNYYENAFDATDAGIY